MLTKLAFTAPPGFIVCTKYGIAIRISAIVAFQPHPTYPNKASLVWTGGGLNEEDAIYFEVNAAALADHILNPSPTKTHD